jgi:hypothetical protein
MSEPPALSDVRRRSSRGAPVPVEASSSYALRPGRPGATRTSACGGRARLTSKDDVALAGNESINMAFDLRGLAPSMPGFPSRYDALFHETYPGVSARR